MNKQHTKYTRSLLTILIVSLGLQVTGCQILDNNVPLPSTTRNQETLVPVSSTLTITKTPTMTIILTGEQTLIPTLALEDAQIRVQQLLETNNNCRLPCWWGITPGKTLWQDALKILAPVSVLNIEAALEKNPSTINVKVHAPNNTHGEVLFQNYVVEDNIVKLIDVYNFDFAPFVYFKRLAHDYGIPDQIYVRGYRDGGLQVALFYPNKGIFAEYSRTSQTDGKNVKACFDDAKSAFLYLWSPNQPMSFDEAMSTFHIQTEDIAAYKPIEEAINNLDEFKTSLTILNSSSCIETPADLWPMRG